MKKKLLSLLCVLLTAVLTAGAIKVLGDLVCPRELVEAADAVAAFHAMPPDSVEVITFGSSHMWYGLDPTVMYKKHGIAAYNYGCYWQKINTTLLFLSDSFRTQSPRIAVIDTFYVNRMKDSAEIDGEIYSTRKIRSPEFKREYLARCFGKDIDKYVGYYIPLYEFHDNWTDVGKDSFGNKADGVDFSSSFGFFPHENIAPGKIEDQTSAEQLPLSAEAEENLDRIVTLCRENGVIPVLITIPYNEAYQYSVAVKEYAEQNGLDYLNFFEELEEMGFNGMTDFSDGAHLNICGAGKVADHLGAFLKSRYELTDMRTVPGNIWSERLDKQ